MFSRYSLRTTDVAAARRFYAESIGLELPPDGASDTSTLEAWRLHGRARALGVPAHWLGHIAVGDVEATADRLVALGGERLGPSVQARDGSSYAALRDPLGAVISVRAGGEPGGDTPVAWHQLHTRDVERAWAIYSELFAWAAKETIEVPDPVGGHRLFAWSADGEPIGSMANTARWPGVHAHWLYYLPVDDLEACAARVRSLGGRAKEPIELREGRWLSACEDPQSAAFGLIQATGARTITNP